MSELLTARESADYRRTSIRTQDRERAEGRGPRYVRIGSRVYYRRADVDAFIARHLCGGERDGANAHNNRAA
jgi:predicted DNA-binding transcriptional regulator AlpA